jgi:hypothetical protein
MKFLFIYIKNKMTIKQQLFNSFIKGIGKTFGTAIVFGFFGTVFYMYSNNQSHKHIKNDQEQDQDHKHLNENDDTNENNLDVQMSNVNNTEDNTEDHTEDHTENNFDDLENIVNSKYKTLFENLLK